MFSREILSVCAHGGRRVGCLMGNLTIKNKEGRIKFAIEHALAAGVYKSAIQC
jgi:hypothetical protein